MRSAVIDIGTNTAHILIAEISTGADKTEIKTLFKERHYTYLAQGDIASISVSAEQALFQAVEVFEAQLKHYACQQVEIFATEALRVASNGERIAQKITAILGAPVQIISGETEAALIFKGVSAFYDLNDCPHVLIVDIGGGSVEFIDVSYGKIQSLHSFPIGISRLFNAFHKSDPISEAEKASLHDFLSKHIGKLLASKAQQNVRLIGAAGSFEVIQKILEIPPRQTVTTDRFNTLARTVINSDRKTRFANAQIPDERVVQVVVAFLLVQYIVNQLNVNEFWVSQYALKEGAILQSTESEPNF